ncbi:hypothetical protein O9G_001115 [Rozella allomycis CSF55]|uniref:Uncharacterized protein n=1 Tax=Rozella allomycis (strain CSF55) TaxID=988480 RepID=A0A075ASA3_ROZAC|nr:hypothetical protein O9G_001115 [Rozella allomycis CSF55]|eukprot:EPZ33146.1 hypothetical protein O9G_001115 [Rozella allomycis CSF55]
MIGKSLLLNKLLGITDSAIEYDKKSKKYTWISNNSTNFESDILNTANLMVVPEGIHEIDNDILCLDGLIFISDALLPFDSENEKDFYHRYIRNIPTVILYNQFTRNVKCNFCPGDFPHLIPDFPILCTSLKSDSDKTFIEFQGKLLEKLRDTDTKMKTKQRISYYDQVFHENWKSKMLRNKVNEIDELSKLLENVSESRDQQENFADELTEYTFKLRCIYPWNYYKKFEMCKFNDIKFSSTCHYITIAMHDLNKTIIDYESKVDFTLSEYMWEIQKQNDENENCKAIGLLISALVTPALNVAVGFIYLYFGWKSVVKKAVQRRREGQKLLVRSVNEKYEAILNEKFGELERRIDILMKRKDEQLKAI